MPAVGAHYQFGRLALGRAGESVRRAVNGQEDMFHLGLQGPDLLFFYEPYHRNPVSQVGYDMHGLSGGSLLVPMLDTRRLWSPALKAYLLGFCCHHALDSNCHPVINVLAPTGVEHQTIEAAFDKLILTQYGVTLKRHKLLPEQVSVDALCQFYCDPTRKELFQSAKSIRRYNWLLGHPKLVAMGEGLVGKQDAFSKMCLPEAVADDHLAHQITPHFMAAIDEAAGTMDALLNVEVDETALRARLPKNFEGETV